MQTHSQSLTRSTIPLRALVLLTSFFVGITYCLAIGPSNVGVDWVGRNPTPLGDDIYAVVGNAATLSPAPIIVAVGGHGLIETSSDNGLTWTKRISPVTTDLNDVIWANSRYLAVGLGGKVVTSTDGLTWVAQTIPGNDDLLSATWTGTRFLVVGGNATAGVAYSSADTIAWVKGTTGVVEHLTSIVSISGGTTILAITPKAILSGSLSVATGVVTFAKKPPTGLVLTADSPATLIANTSNKLFLSTRTIGGGAGNTWKSDNGTLWTKNTPAGLVSSVLYLHWTGTDILATGPAGDAWTSDGTTWVARPTGQSQELFGGTKAASSPNASYIAVGEGGRVFTIAPPAESTWTSRLSTGGTADIAGVGTNGTAFVAAGNGFTMTSPDGSAWTNVPQTGLNLRSIAHTGAQYVIAGTKIHTSTNGVTLTEVKAQVANETLNRVIWTGTNVVATGFDATTAAPRSLIYRSADGTTWTKMTVPTTAITALNGAASTPGGGLVVAVGNGGNVLTSADFGITWVKRSVVLTALEHFTDATYFNNAFIAVTNKGGIWTSTNGTTWVKRRASSLGGFSRILAVGNQAIAVGDFGRGARSFGGTVWQDVDTTTSQNQKDLAWNGTRLVSGGDVGSIITSDGSQPTRPAVNFSVASATAKETDVAGAAPTVTISVTPIPANPVTVLYTLSGTATNVADYTVPVVPVVLDSTNGFSKTITITPKVDVIDEADETVTLSLGAPTGDAVLGATKTYTLTIVDQFPTFSAHPTNKLVLVGANTSFTATATGSSAMVGTWKKNGGVTAGLTSATSGTPPTITYTGTINNVQLSHAGAYTLAIASASGAKVSDPAQLGVVENIPATVIKNSDDKVTIPVKSAGTVGTLTYQWRHDGIEIHNSADARITGTNTIALNIKNLDASDRGVYTCRVTQTTAAGQLTVDGATTTLAVLSSAPAILTASLPSTTVGQPYDFTPVASDYTTGWTITGLGPTGLTANAVTGRITGQATASGDFPITLTAVNSLGSGPAVTLNLHITGLPANFADTYYALIDRSVDTNLNLGAFLEVTTTLAGQFTGKLIEGAVTTNIPVTQLTYQAVGPTLTATFTVAPVTPSSPAGLTPLPTTTISFTITPGTKTFVGSQVNGATTVNLTGTAKSQWAAAAVPTNKQGLYNFAINPIEGFSPLTDEGRPLGFGFGSFSLPADGTAVVAGQTADGKAYTTSSVLTAAGQVMVYGGAYTTLGSLHGLLDVTVKGFNYTNPDTSVVTPEVKISGNLTSYRGAEPVPSDGTERAAAFAAQRSYRLGFKNPGGTVAVLTLAADGGHYFPPPTTVNASNTGIILNIPNQNNNLNMTFLYGGLKTAAARSTSNNPDTVFTIDPAAVVTDYNNKTIVTSDPVFNAATGRFNGTFGITDADPFGGPTPVNRSGIVFNGIIIRQFINGDSAIQHRGFGYFTLPKLPAAGDGPGAGPSDLTNSPILSGQVKLVP